MNSRTKGVSAAAYARNRRLSTKAGEYPWGLYLVRRRRAFHFLALVKTYFSFFLCQRAAFRWWTRVKRRRRLYPRIWRGAVPWAKLHLRFRTKLCRRPSKWLASLRNARLNHTSLLMLEAKWPEDHHELPSHNHLPFPPVCFPSHPLSPTPPLTNKKPRFDNSTRSHPPPKQIRQVSPPSGTCSRSHR